MLCGHIEGMLDRDQRTVRTRCPHHHQHHHHHQQQQHYTTTTETRHNQPHWSTQTTTTTQLLAATVDQASDARSCERRARKTITLWKIMQRLKRVLVLSVYLLSIVHIPRMSCAPTYRMGTHPKWINPCGMSSAFQQDGEGTVVSDKDLLNQIVVQARIAHTEADNFKDEFVQKTFNMDFEQNHQHWKTNRYDWLPKWDEIPKGLGEKTPQEHLDNLELDQSLLDIYKYLQKLAVGLEQIVWDQEDDHAPFRLKFRDAEFKLRLLLCEIQGAIVERGMEIRENVGREIMTGAFRDDKSMSFRNLRDWLIFRDYMNALEYVIEVFEHFKNML